LYKQTIHTELEKYSFDIKSKNEIDEMLELLQRVIKNAMDKCIPTSKSCAYKRPYWDTELADCHNKQKALRWTWVTEGRPRGMQYNSYYMYKLAKREFSNLLVKKQLHFKQSKFQQAENHIEMEIFKS